MASRRPAWRPAGNPVGLQHALWISSADGVLELLLPSTLPAFRMRSGTDARNQSPASPPAEHSRPAAARGGCRRRCCYRPILGPTPGPTLPAPGFFASSGPARSWAES
jgi:hypothetical protein